MQVEAIELVRLRVPLVAPWVTPLGVEAERDVSLVHVIADGRDGWGECVAMGSPTYTAEFAAGAFEILKSWLLPTLLAGRVTSPDEVSTALGSFKGHPMAKAAVETAVLDAFLRRSDRSLSEYLGGTRRRVDAGVAVGLVEDLDKLVETVGAYVDEGYRRVKLKVKPGWDIHPVGAVRKAFPDLAIQVDANGSYGRDDVARLAALDRYHLLMIEQPLPEDDLAGHASVASRIETHICLDESITSLGSALTALDAGACSVVCIKAGRVGGYLEAKRIHDACLERGVAVWCGGMLETGVGRAANLALASLAGFTLPGDLSASSRYFHQDVTAPITVADGRVEVPSGPGLGVEPLPERLEQFAVSRQWIKAQM